MSFLSTSNMPSFSIINVLKSYLARHILLGISIFNSLPNYQLTFMKQDLVQNKLNIYGNVNFFYPMVIGSVCQIQRHNF